jgi:hypothetical protein
MSLQEEPGRAGQGSEEHQIPQSRFDEAVGKERSRADQAAADAAAATARAAAAEARLSALEEQAKTEETPGAADIARAIEAGQIENADGIALIARQTEQRAVSSAVTQAKAEIKAEQIQQQELAELERYREVIPGLKQSGSDEDMKAGKAYKELVDRGQPQNLTTTLLAIERTFGKIESLEATPLRREGHPEVGGSGHAGGSSSSEGVPSFITKVPGLQKQYEKRIASGQYKGWDDPRIAKHAAIVEKKAKAASA